MQSGGIGPVFGQGGGVGELSWFAVICLSFVKRSPLFKKSFGTFVSSAATSIASWSLGGNSFTGIGNGATKSPLN